MRRENRRAARIILRAKKQPKSSAPSGNTQATVISVHGAIVRVRDTTGKQLRVKPRRALPPLACGDRVEIEWQRGAGHIVTLHARQSLLARSDRYNTTRPIAANLDLVVLVISPRPAAPAQFADRCLLNLELQDITPLIVFNKIDLPEAATLKESQALYQRIGYEVMGCSTKLEGGTQALRDRLANLSSLMVGVSGAGKSSLAQALIPGEEIKVGNLAGDGNHGAHTTSTARLIDLPQGGTLIDSPGVRDFGTWHISSEDVAPGFREFQDLLWRCKFRDCRHRADIGCAVRAAVEDGRVEKARWKNYLDILTESEAMEAARYD